MNFEVSNRPVDLLGEVRLTIDTDRELAGEILEFAYRRYEELDRQRADELFARLNNLG